MCGGEGKGKWSRWGREKTDRDREWGGEPGMGRDTDRGRGTRNSERQRKR